MGRGADGGFFVPFRMPDLPSGYLSALKEKTFGQNIADILNIFFSAKLTGWDVEATIGRRPWEIKSMNRRIFVAELWHNMDNGFHGMIRSLAERIHPDGELIGKPTNWVSVAVRIAVLFGIFGELMKQDGWQANTPINVAVTSGSFAMPMAVWYARQLGLPVKTIICGCNENGAPWDLLHRGQVDTDALAVKTRTPECDYALPPDMERLIYSTMGQEEAMRYWWCCTEGASYIPPEGELENLRKGMFAAVVSCGRVESIIPSVYRTNRYILDLYGTLAYGALSDYRSGTGDNGVTLLLSEKSPLCDAQAVAKAMRISVAELKERLAEG